jgi:VanZ family protein
LALAGWTLALLTPEPAQVSAATLPPDLGYIVAKAAHVSAYAFLTALAAWLPLRRHWPLVVLLSLHGCATEYLQQFVPLRHGCLPDVGWDHLGLAFGLAISWKWRRRQGGARG